MEYLDKEKVLIAMREAFVNTAGEIKKETDIDTMFFAIESRGWASAIKVVEEMTPVNIEYSNVVQFPARGKET